MSRRSASWPALAGQPAESFPYARGVWGKAHGAASDFRWLARSADFLPGNLARQLALGAEDRRERATFWLPLERRCYAGVVYPSRAMDAAGRQGTLEKQVLDWSRPPAVPAALGALALLPLASRLDDQVWWQRRGDSAWQAPDFAVPIPPHELAAARLSAEDLAEVIDQGIAALVAQASAAALTALYSQLLAGCRPALLRGLSRPLPAAALAVLLLPLPAARANRTSLAGWLPSSRVAAGELAVWDVIVPPPSLAVAQSLGAGADVAPEAMAMAQALLEADPSRLPVADPRPARFHGPLDRGEPTAPPALFPPPANGDERPPALLSASVSAPGEPSSRPVLRLELTPPPPDAPPAIRALHGFAAAAGRRWLDPDALPAGPPLRAGDPSVPVLLGWIEEAARQRGEADAEQWEVKLDLLRSAALTLVPPAASRDPRLRPVSGRVPPLRFAAARGEAGYRLLQELGEEGLAQAVSASLACATDSLRLEVWRWLERACSQPRLRPLAPRLRALLARHREEHPAALETPPPT